MATPKEAAAPTISDKFIADQAALGQDMYDTQRNGPPRTFTVPTAAPNWRDTLISGLLGLNAGTKAGADVAKLGAPEVGLLAGIGAGVETPRQLEEMKLKHMQSLPVEQVSPGLVEAHPELQGVPLGIIDQMRPFIIAKDKLDNTRLMFSQNAALKEEMAKASPAMKAFFESQLQLAPGALSTLKAGEESGLKPTTANGGRMSPELFKLLENAKDGLNSISEAKAILARTKPETLKKASIGGKLGDFARLGDEDAQALHSYLKNAGDVITRLRTGAALNMNEEVYYGKIVNDFFKTGKVNKEQIDRLEKFFQTVQADIEAGRRGAPSRQPVAAAPKPVAAPDPAGIRAKPKDPLGVL